MYVDHSKPTRPATRPAAPPPRHTDVTTRVVGPGDERLVSELLMKASAHTLFQRFHAPLPRVPSHLVEALTRVRPGERESVLAFRGTGPVGHAQWARVDDDGTPRAEIAVMVIDAHQGAGIGRLLVEEVAERAWDAGLRDAVLHVRPDNRVLRDALRRRGAVLSADAYLLPLRALRRRGVVRWMDAVPSPRTSDGHLPDGR